MPRSGEVRRGWCGLWKLVRSTGGDRCAPQLLEDAHLDLVWAEPYQTVKPYIDLSVKLGKLQGQLAEGWITRVEAGHNDGPRLRR